MVMVGGGLIVWAVIVEVDAVVGETRVGRMVSPTSFVGGPTGWQLLPSRGHFSCGECHYARVCFQSCALG